EVYRVDVHRLGLPELKILGDDIARDVALDPEEWLFFLPGVYEVGKRNIYRFELFPVVFRNFRKYVRRVNQFDDGLLFDTRGRVVPLGNFAQVRAVSITDLDESVAFYSGADNQFVN